MNLEAQAEVALKAAYLAGELLNERPDTIAVTRKGSFRDVVSDFDTRVERYLTTILEPTGYPVIGEESFVAGIGYSDPPGPFWLIDPIDGTANFVAGFPYYCVSVGLCDFSASNDQFLLGALSMPALKELYFTSGDKGSYLNGRLLDVGALSVNLENSLVNFSFAGKAGQLADSRQYELFGQVNRVTRGALRIGSAAAGVCNVAAGRLQGAVGIDNKFWDVAAAIAIARLAGAKVHTYRQKGSPQITFVAGYPRVADALLEMVKEAGIIP